MTKSVYLAGPISGLSFAGASDWRRHVRDELAKSGIDAFSPMRWKDYLAGFDVLSGHGREYSHLSPLSSPRGVITRDRFDATRCDVLLVNLLGATQVSIGTVMEIAWADLSRIPIVCAMEKEGNPHEHMMVAEAIGFRVDTLDAAIHCIRAILNHD